MNNFKIKEFTKNYIVYGLYHILNIILPFIVIYLLLPKIGKNLYSNLVLITSITTFFKIIYDFGYEYVGARLIIKDDNHLELNSIFNNVLSFKFILISIFTVPFFIICYIILDDNNLIFISFHIIAITLYTMNPIWFLYSQKKYFSLLINNLIVLSIVIFGIEYYILDIKSWYLYSVFFMLGHLISLFFSILYIKSRFSFLTIYIELNYSKIIKSFLEAFNVNNFNILSNIYVSSSTIIMQLFSVNNILISDYGIAEKIVRGLRQILMPINKITYPILLNRNNNEDDYYKIILAKLSMLIFAIGLILSVFTLIFDERIIFYLNITDDIMVLRLIKLFIPIFTIGSLSGFLSINYYILLGYENKLNVILLEVVSIFLLSSVVLIPILSVIGAAVAVILAETYLCFRIVIQILYAKTEKSI